MLFKKMLQIKKSWATKVAAKYGRKYVIMGGSSAAFSFDAKRLVTEHDLPVVNGGLYAAMGPKLLTQVALEMLNPGDTLIVALEPGLLTNSLESTTFAVQFSFAAGHSEWVTRDKLGIPGIPYLSALLALRPGGYHLVTALGKRVRNLPAYRYSIKEVDDAGFLQPAVRMNVTGPPSHRGKLSGAARGYLTALRKECERRDVRVAYVLPWAYCPPESLLSFQVKNRSLLLEIAAYLPVLKEERLGAYSVREHFADTAWHLIGDGARMRTDSFAGALKRWDLWTVEDLARWQP
ncbi:MAG: hypothetical protein EOP84_02025 [Verrucomicrobiaceae bacterium]|nr:MAG: hypothetical protein EOP84_02025 [Verrucomicrobiaceae bacterium]